MSDSLLNIRTVEEAIFDLALRVDLETLPSFFKAYSEFDYLLNNTHFMELLAERNNVPYSDNLNFLILYSRMNINQKLTVACSRSDYDSVIRMLNLGATNFADAIIDTIKHSDTDILDMTSIVNIVKLLLDQGVSMTFYYKILLTAAEEDISEVIPLVYENVSHRQLNGALVSASRNASINSVKLLVKLGADSFDGALLDASIYGNFDIVMFLLSVNDYNLNSLNTALLEASFNGHINVILLLINSGANDFQGALDNAANGNQPEVVELMIKLDTKSVLNFQQALINASGSDSIDIVKLLANKEGITEINIMQAITEAQAENYPHIIKYLNEVLRLRRL